MKDELSELEDDARYLARQLERLRYRYLDASPVIRQSLQTAEALADGTANAIHIAAVYLSHGQAPGEVDE